MSNLPEINYQKVSQRLGTDIGTSAVTRAALEILAEQLREERDAARLEVEQLRQRLSASQTDGDTNAVQS